LTQDSLFLDAALRETDGTPPEVLQELAGLTLQPTPAHNEHQHLVATA
jgi:hypothetical protein